MVIKETATGNDSVAIAGTASAGERTVGIKGIGDSVGIRGEGKAWHGVAGLSESTIGGNGVFDANRNGTGVRGESETKFNAGVFGLYKGESGWEVHGEADKAYTMENLMMMSNAFSKSVSWFMEWGICLKHGR